MPIPPGLAVITGASSGLGAAFARRVSATGAPVLLVARRQDRLDALIAELPGPAERVVADLSTAEGVDAVWAAIGDREVGLLINNAGTGALGPFAEADERRLVEMVQLNCAAVVRLTRRVLPGMLARGRGRVIVVSSVGAFQGTPQLSVYGATKGFDLLFAEALAEELRGSGVQVQALCPGATATEFADRVGIRARRMESSWMRPEDVVDVALAAPGRRHVVIPGFVNALGAWLTRLFPRRAATRVAGLIGAALLGDPP